MRVSVHVYPFNKLQNSPANKKPFDRLLIQSAWLNAVQSLNFNEQIVNEGFE